MRSAMAWTWLLLALLWTASAAADEPPALPGDTTAIGVDTTLLVAVLRALEGPDARRAETLAAPALAADPRAVGALRYLALHDRRPEVVARAVAVLGGVPTGAAATALRDALIGAEGSPSVQAAAPALSQHPSGQGGALLHAVAVDESIDNDVRRLALDRLRRDHAALLAKLGEPQLGGSAALATVGGAYFGGWALSSVGGFAGTSSADSIGWVAGAVVGAGTGYILGRHLPLQRQTYYLSALAWGSWIGWQSADAVVNRPVDAFGNRASDAEVGLSRTRAGLALVGELAGAGLAFLGADRLDFSNADVLTTNVIAGATTLASWGGLSLLRPRNDRRPGVAGLLSGSLIGLVAGVAASPKLNFDAGDVALTGLLTAEGAYFGGFLSDRFAKSRPVEAGMGLGAGIGALTGLALAQSAGLTPGDVGQVLLFSSFGKALGAGISFIGNARDDTANLVHLAGGAAGLVAGAVLAGDTDYAGGDYAMVPVATALGLWHGAWLGALGSDLGVLRKEGDVVGGMALAGGALLGAGGAALAQHTEYTTGDVVLGSAGAMWGAWFAGWSMALTDKMSERGRAAAMLVGTDVGLATTAILTSGMVGLDQRVLAGANFGGVAGAGLGALLTAMFTSNTDRIIQANLAGSAVGLLAGGAIARVIVGDRRSAHWQLPSLPEGWRVPFDSVVAAPRLGADGRLDGFTLQALAMW